MTTETGSFRNNESFFQLMDTGGDCYEAAEECFGMVQILAEELSRLAPQRTRQEWVSWANQRPNYERGLRIGGRQRDR